MGFNIAKLLGNYQLSGQANALRYLRRISPYIKPGTVSNRYYNHYSWLRTMEDLFGVKEASPGLDG